LAANRSYVDVGRAKIQAVRDFNPRTIRAALRGRGVALNPPVTADALGLLTRWAGLAPHQDVGEVLRESGGFSDGEYEQASFISVWTVDAAIAHQWTTHPMPAFSEWAISAMMFGLDPVTGGPAISIEDGREAAPSYREFWPRLLAASIGRSYPLTFSAKSGSCLMRRRSRCLQRVGSQAAAVG
jgi:hypothetical protein